MGNIFSKIFFNEKYIKSLFILLISINFCALIFYRYALEHIRYIFITLIFLTFFINKNIVIKVTQNIGFRALLFFLVISSISLLTNSHSLKYIDEVVNWIIIFTAAYFTSFHLGTNRAKIFILLPIVLFTVYIVVPGLIGDGLHYVNPLSPRRLHIFFAQRANHLGLISGIATLVTLHFSLTKTLLSDRIAYSLLTLFSLLIHISTGSRTVFAATLLVCGIWVLWRFRKSTRTILLIVGTVAVAALLVLQFNALGNNRLTRLGVNARQDVSFQQRILTWTIATDTIREKPWFGEGFDTFEKQFKAGRRHYASLPDFKQRFPHTSGNTNNAHNFSLHFLAETGIFGLATITFFWFFLIYKGFRIKTDTGLIVSGALLLSYLSFQLNMGLYGSQLSTLIFSFAGLSAYEIDELSK